MPDYELCLYHHGVKGMKWGVRKSRQKSKELDSKRADYKRAKKEYDKSFKKASNRSFAAYSPSKRQRENNDKRWDDAWSKGEVAVKAERDYKDARKEFRKNANPKVKAERGMKAAGRALVTVGKLYALDRALTGGKGAKLVGAGAKAAKNAILNKMFDTTLIDKDGKVIYRYNSTVRERKQKSSRGSSSSQSNLPAIY